MLIWVGLAGGSVLFCKEALPFFLRLLLSFRNERRFVLQTPQGIRALEKRRERCAIAKVPQTEPLYLFQKIKKLSNRSPPIDFFVFAEL